MIKCVPSWSNPILGGTCGCLEPAHRKPRSRSARLDLSRALPGKTCGYTHVKGTGGQESGRYGCVQTMGGFTRIFYWSWQFLLGTIMINHWFWNHQWPMRPLVILRVRGQLLLQVSVVAMPSEGVRWQNPRKLDMSWGCWHWHSMAFSILEWRADGSGWGACLVQWERTRW